MSTSTKSLEAPKGKGEMPQVYNNYIGGRWVKAKNGETFPSVNPADVNEVVGHFASSGPEDVKAAVDAAAKAFPAWKRVPAPARAEILLKAAHLLETRKEEIAQIMVREMGKVIKEARGDVQEAIDMALLMAGEGRRLFGLRLPDRPRAQPGRRIRHRVAPARRARAGGHEERVLHAGLDHRLQRLAHGARFQLQEPDRQRHLRLRLLVLHLSPA